MSAIRLARGFTGRDLIVKFAGCYHGHVDSPARLGRLQRHSRSACRTAPACRRAAPPTRSSCASTTSQGLREAFRGAGRPDRRRHPRAGRRQHGPGRRRPPSSSRELRRLTQQHGALLIYDEVMTGFRLAYGGAQELFGDTPDLTVLGKIVGGGYPVGAYGGRADVMKKIMPAGPVFQAGTLSGNPVAMAAGIATLQELQDEPALRPARRAGPDARRRACARRRRTRACRTSSTASAACGRCSSPPTPVTDYDTAKTSDTARFARFFWAMMDRGVYLPCSQFEAAFLSVPMTASTSTRPSPPPARPSRPSRKGSRNY